jgi:hypothetical protein
MSRSCDRFFLSVACAHLPINEKAAIARGFFYVVCVFNISNRVRVDDR